MTTRTHAQVVLIRASCIYHPIYGVLTDLDPSISNIQKWQLKPNPANLALLKRHIPYPSVYVEDPLKTCKPPTPSHAPDYAFDVERSLSVLNYFLCLFDFFLVMMGMPSSLCTLSCWAGNYVGIGAAAPVMPFSGSSTGSTGPQVQNRFISPNARCIVS
jgi:hypothetical protein